MTDNPTLTIQYGKFYCRLPTDNLESIRFAIKWLEFWEKYLEERNDQTSEVKPA